jgi:hypothetical protein
MTYRAPDDNHRCTAHNQNAARCYAYAIPGGKVCRYHGGAAPQVKLAAEDRLRALVHPAITGLQQLIAQADSDSVRLSAIRDLLDRTGYKPTEKIQTTGDSTIRVEYADAATPTVTPEHRNGHA